MKIGERLLRVWTWNDNECISQKRDWAENIKEVDKMADLEDDRRKPEGKKIISSRPESIELD